MMTQQRETRKVINDRLFDPDGCLIFSPNEGAIGISETACRLLSALVASPGAPQAAASLAQAARPQSAPEDTEIMDCVGELNRLLGRLPSGGKPIEQVNETEYMLLKEALENQPPPTDPRFGYRPFHRRPATWGSLIAIVLALMAFALLSSPGS